MFAQSPFGVILHNFLSIALGSGRRALGHPVRGRLAGAARLHCAVLDGRPDNEPRQDDNPSNGIPDISSPAALHNHRNPIYLGNTLLMIARRLIFGIVGSFFSLWLRPSRRKNRREREEKAWRKSSARNTTTTPSASGDESNSFPYPRSGKETGAQVFTPSSASRSTQDSSA